MSNNDIAVHTLFADFAAKTTWHGIPDLFVAATCKAKVFWLIMLSISTAMLVYQVYNLLTNYIDGQPYHTIMLSVTVGSEGIFFPNITICNFGRTSNASLSHYNVSNDALSFIYGTVPQYYTSSSYLLNDSNLLDKQSDAMELLHNRYPNMTALDWLSMTGHSSKDIFVDCWWTGIPFNCTSYINSVFNVFGKCHSITPPPDMPWGAADPPTQNIPGPANGLTLRLNPRLNDIRRPYYNDYLSDGLVVFVNAEPDAFWPTDPIVFEPHTSNFVSLKLEAVETVTPAVMVFPMPCRSKANFHYIKEPYSITRCILDCFIYTVANYCKCLFSMGSGQSSLRNNLNNLLNCSYNDSLCQTACFYGLEGVYIDAFIQYLNCTSLCAVPCNSEFTYKTTMTRTVAAFITDVVLSENIPTEDVADIIQVDFYYPFIGLTQKITEETTSIFDLIGNLGGQLGLWAGMSVLSLCQMCFYLGQNCICHSCFREKKTKVVSIAVQ